MPAAERRPSVAILPFVNMSGDREQEYFSDGLAEEIINALARLPDLKVTARTSAFAFKGKEAKVGDIARELGVEHVLEGSVRKGGQRIRIAAQLVNAADGCPVWSERWDREITDVFAVQDEIASAITAVLQSKLAVKAPAIRFTPRVDAYEAYLKGRHFTWSFTLNRFAEARRFYEEAIRLEPTFALAYAGLAEYFHIASLGDGSEGGRRPRPRCRGTGARHRPDAAGGQRMARDLRDHAGLRLAGSRAIVPRGDGSAHRLAGNPPSVRLFSSSGGRPGR